MLVGISPELFVFPPNFAFAQQCLVQSVGTAWGKGRQILKREAFDMPRVELRLKIPACPSALARGPGALSEK